MTRAGVETALQQSPPAADAPTVEDVTRAAAFFDLDKTVIAKSSTLAFGRPFFQGGLINRRAVLKGAYAQFVFSLAGADHDQMERMRSQITAMTRGWDVTAVHDIVRETLHDIVDPLVYAEAADLIEEHRAAGREIVIVSSSGAEVVGPIGEMLGVHRVVATRMIIRDGRYTGEVDFYAYGENKAAAAREVAAEGGYDLADCWAYSDSVTDLPLLEAVGHPVAVNPDRGLRRVAAERSWPVLEFTRPVTMRSRFAGARTPVVTGAAVGVGAAMAGLAWYARRRALRLVPATVSGADGHRTLPLPTAAAGRRRRRGA
jgi:HAD superfamily hydrolase (TIGR01490 family)